VNKQENFEQFWWCVTVLVFSLLLLLVGQDCKMEICHGTEEINTQALRSRFYLLLIFPMRFPLLCQVSHSILKLRN